MKQVYSYDYSGKYIGMTEAELCQVTEMKKIADPELESVYIMPSYSTEIAPPEFKHDSEIAVFKDGAWLVEELPKPEEKEIVKLTYQELRAKEYPSMCDYLDGIVKGDTAQVQKYIDDCKAVKLKYPKV
jgi:hypothetical protein